MFVLSSCQYVPTITLKDLNQSYMKISDAETKIAKLKDAHVKELSENAEKIVVGQTKVIGGKDGQLQAGADSLYTIQQVSSLPIQPGSIEFIRARAIEGFTAMGKPPTIKEIIEGGERLKKYLTTYKDNDPVQIEILRKEHAELVKQNGILVETTKAAEKEVESVKAEKLKIEQKFIATNTLAQTELSLANKAVIDKEHQRAEQERAAKEKAEDWKSLIRQLMIWCGIGSALALVGAVYSPVGKGGLASIAGVLAVVTIALPFVTPTVVWIVLAVVLLGAALAAWHFLYKHNQSEKVNDNMIHAIQDTKDNPNATIDDLKANLREWNTTYVKDKLGNVTSKIDTKADDYIKSKLMKSGRFKANDSKDSALLTPPK